MNTSNEYVVDMNGHLHATVCIPRHCPGYHAAIEHDGLRKVVWCDLGGRRAEVEEIVDAQMRKFNEVTGRTVASLDGFGTARQIRQMLVATAQQAMAAVSV